MAFPALLANFPDNILAAGLQDLGNDAAKTAVLDKDGIPTGWRLFAFGPFSITKDGKTVAGSFLPAHADAILAHAEKKGNRIPIDSEHGLAVLADKLGVDEADLVPLLNRNKVTMGFGSLELRADQYGTGSLWLRNVQWVPLARKIMAEKVLQYFSPVIRGLKDGNLRITSVALTNTPALDQLDAIAATAEEPITTAIGSNRQQSTAADAILDAGERGPRVPPGSSKRAATPNQKGASMKGLLAKLGALIGLAEADVAALTAESAESALLPKLQPLIDEIPALRAARAAQEAFLGDLRTGLKLSAETPAEAVKGRLLALIDKAGKDAEQLSAVTARVQALEAEQTAGKRQALIDRALADGKLTPALVEKWAKNQDVAALTAFLENAPVLIPPGRLTDPAKLQQDAAGDFTADDVKMSAVCGNDPEKVKAAWKKHQEAVRQP